MTTIAERYARYAAEFSLDRAPASVQRHARRLILDAVGVALAASTRDFARQTAAALCAFGSGDSDVIGMRTRLALRDAVLANGALIHGLDFDDTHKPGNIHVTAGCLPVALALAADRRLTGCALLEAYVLGVELATRLGMVARRRFNPAGFHATGLVAAYGCALVAGKLYGLDAEALTMAQGIVHSMASGTREYSADASGSKRLHPGWAGVAGITAAVLARAGISGPRTAYEGRYGLYATHLRDGVGKLFGGRVPQICASSQEYYRDVYDHLTRLNQSIDALREMLSTALSVNLSLITVQENETTKRLAACAALVAVPTMIAGVYGMNFRHMPELDWQFGYPVTIAAMLAIDAYLYYRFHRAGWL